MRTVVEGWASAVKPNVKKLAMFLAWWRTARGPDSRRSMSTVSIEQRAAVARKGTARRRIRPSRNFDESGGTGRSQKRKPVIQKKRPTAREPIAINGWCSGNTVSQAAVARAEGA
jgi:hypothetical protein